MTIANFQQRRGFWGLVFGYCVFLEAGALFYQLVLGYPPCELCIHVRLWLGGLALATLCGIFVSRYRLARMALSLVSLALVAGLASVTWELLGIEYRFGPPGSCAFVIYYPEWLPLDRWWPAMFEVQGSCMATPEVIAGISMADVLAASCIVLFAAFAWALISDALSMLRFGRKRD